MLVFSVFASDEYSRGRAFQFPELKSNCIQMGFEYGEEKVIFVNFTHIHDSFQSGAKSQKLCMEQSFASVHETQSSHEHQLILSII